MKTYIWLLRILAITVIICLAILIWGQVWNEPPVFGV